MSGEFTIYDLRLPNQVGRVTPCAPLLGMSGDGAHGVARPTCLSFVIRHSLFILTWLLFTATSHALPTRKTNDEIPQLAPPLPEMPPTFSEQHGWMLWLAVPLVLLVAAVIAAIWLRPRKPPALIAPAAQARAALTSLQGCSEDGSTLSQISQTMRRYLIATFWLHPGETTTAEFCANLATNAQVGPELSTVVGEFLKHCDERKFSPAASPAATGAATRALELVELAEARRTSLRKASTTSPA